MVTMPGMRLLVVVTLVVGTGAFFANHSDEEAFVQSRIDLATKYSPHQNLMNRRVAVHLDMFQIVAVDEKRGEVNAKFWYFVHYTLEQLAWNSSQLGLDHVEVPEGTFWTPDLVGLEITEVIKSNNMGTQSLRNDGRVTSQSSLVNWKFSCDFNVEKFPFDTQSCLLTFGRWFSTPDDYKFDLSGDGAYQSVPLQLRWYKENDQWLLTDATLTEALRDGHQYIDMSITIVRRSQYFVNVLVVPIVTLAMISSMTFLLPVESGEKVSLGVTVLLSQIVSLLVLNDILPASSKSFPILGRYALVTIILISVSVLLATLVIIIHNMSDESKVPRVFRVALRSRLMHVLFIAPIGVSKVAASETPRSLESDEKSKEACPPDGAVGTNLPDVGERVVTWPDVALMVDRCMLVVYLTMMTGFTVGSLARLT